jgi:WhiB family redox-sensing transcriptional regulator
MKDKDIDRPPPCRDHPENWFPVGTTGPALALESEAVAVCHTCPFEEICLKIALAENREWGVWGGKTARQRKGMFRGDPESAHRFREQDEKIRAIPLSIANNKAAAMLGIDPAAVRRVRLQPVDLGR